MKPEKYNAALHYHTWLKMFADNKKDEEKDETLPEDCVRYEEHTDEEYLAHLKKFFKGKNGKTKDD